MNAVCGIIFYPTIGLFAINPLEDLHDLTFFVTHHTILPEKNI
jgi:hypothetical protein